MTFFTACDNANSSALILDVVIIAYLQAFHEIVPLNNFMINLCELLQSRLSAKNALLAQINVSRFFLSDPPNCRT